MRRGYIGEFDSGEKFWMSPDGTLILSQSGLLGRRSDNLTKGDSTCAVCCFRRNNESASVSTFICSHCPQIPYKRFTIGVGQVLYTDDHLCSITHTGPGAAYTIDLPVRDSPHTKHRFKHTTLIGCGVSGFLDDNNLPTDKAEKSSELCVVKLPATVDLPRYNFGDHLYFVGDILAMSSDGSLVIGVDGSVFRLSDMSFKKCCDNCNVHKLCHNFCATTGCNGHFAWTFMGNFINDASMPVVYSADSGLLVEPGCIERYVQEAGEYAAVIRL